MNKVCSTCFKAKGVEGFYHNKRSKDGFQYRCKDCMDAAVKKWQLKTGYLWKSETTEYFRRYQREWARKHPRPHSYKYTARAAVARALKRGSLIRKPCEKCGSKDRIQAHHPDYSKPLQVKWLCKKHHDMAHGRRTVKYLNH